MSSNNPQAAPLDTDPSDIYRVEHVNAAHIVVERFDDEPCNPTHPEIQDLVNQALQGAAYVVEIYKVWDPVEDIYQRHYWVIEPLHELMYKRRRESDAFEGTFTATDELFGEEIIAQGTIDPDAIGVTKSHPYTPSVVPGPPGPRGPKGPKGETYFESSGTVAHKGHWLRRLWLGCVLASCTLLLYDILRNFF